MDLTTLANGGLATVFGGTGFVGRHIVRALAQAGWRVRAAVRNPNIAGYLVPAGGVGQVCAVQANVRYPDSVAAALRGADVAINASGVAMEARRQSYEAVNVFGSSEIGKAAAHAGLSALVHVSGIGADAESSSRYIASKGRAEEAIRAAFPATTILRPSVVFGPEDDVVNRFAALARMMPLLPLFGGGASKLQPVYVGDVAAAVVNVLANASAAGRTYELGGPEVMTLRELAAYVVATTGRRRFLAPVPFPVARTLASMTQIASAVTLGKFPRTLTTSPDQIELLRHDNIVSPEAIADHRDLAGLSVAPRALDSIAPAYLARYRKTGQFDAARA
jgi:uncharacterized protein YbjT (DUF2867 family)